MSQVFFLDERLPDRDALIQALPPGSLWFLLNATSDGISQIEAALAGQSELEAIHLISHGAPGSLLLGNSTLNFASLENQGEALARIGSSLSASGDLLLYGCAVGGGPEGLALVDALAAATGADVAASADVTGASGNWTLEVSAGTVTTAPLQPENYNGSLATAPTLDPSYSPTLGSVLEGATDPAGMSIADLIIDGSITDPDGAVEAIALEAVDTSLGTWQYQLSGSSQWLTIRSELLNSTTNTLALLLGPNDRLRLLPFGDLNGTLTNAIGFRAWDQSSGDAGTYAITTPGVGAYSSASDTASIELTPVNDAPTFSPVSGGGKLDIDVGSSSDEGTCVTLQADGKIILAGYSYQGTDKDFSLTRLNSDGSLDPSFGIGGKTVIPVGSSYDDGRSVTIQADGKIILAGGSDNGSGSDFSLIRLNSDGSLDTDFHADGKLIQSVGLTTDYGESVTVQTDGKIVLAGYSQNGSDYDFSLIRLNPDGELDTSFGTGGKLLVSVGSSYDYGRSITIQADGKIIVAGESYGGPDFSLIRLNADGSLDTTFHADGKLIVPVGSSYDYGRSVTIQADGKIILAGSSNNGSDSDFSLIRLNTDGSLDASFGSGGKAIIPVGSSNDASHSVTLQADGKIILGGISLFNSQWNFGLVRLKEGLDNCPARKWSQVRDRSLAPQTL